MSESKQKSLYAQYILEREGRETFETDEGFVTYKIFKDQNYIYLVDMFIKEENREESKASQLFLNKVQEEGLEAGVDNVITSVAYGASGLENSIKLILANGFKVLEGNNQLIYFIKPIKLK